MGHMSTSKSAERRRRLIGPVRGSLKLSLSVFILTLIIVIVGVSTRWPPILGGVVAGLCAVILGFSAAIKMKADVRRDRNNSDGVTHHEER
jgi:hypothetical protein